MALFKKKRRGGDEIVIYDAVARGLVQVDVLGAGEGVTSRIRLQVTKLTDDDFTLVVPRGTEFIPTVRTAQSQ